MKLENEYQTLLLKAKQVHSDFLQKYSQIIEKNMADTSMFNDLIYSKLTFVAKILKDAGVIKGYKESDIDIAGNLFSRSLILDIGYPFMKTYLLNGVKDVFIYEGDTITPIDQSSGFSWSFVMWGENSSFKTKKFTDVLNDDFNWEEFVMYVVDTIHKISYKRKSLTDQLFG